jgi:hypothetical protein
MSVCLLYVLMVLTVSVNFSDWQWSLLTEDRKTKVYYDRTSIKNIDDNVIEVYSASDRPDSRTVRQLRVDCMTHTFAIGISYKYKPGSETPYYSFDFSRKGWNWFPPGDKIEEKFISVVCKKST